MNPEKNLRIIDCNKAKNLNLFFVFGQVYVPMLAKEEILVFMGLMNHSRIKDVLNRENYKCRNFIEGFNLTREQVENALQGLSRLKLIKIEDRIESTNIYIKRVRTLVEVMENEFLTVALRKSLPQEKYHELENMAKASLEAENEREFTSFNYSDFYGNVREMLGHDFDICSESLKIIKVHQEVLAMEDFQECAYWAMVKVNNKYRVSVDNFSFLIKQKMSENAEDFSIDEHHEFWKNLKETKPETIAKEFKRLFGKNSPFTLYRMLTNKDKAPDALHKWIKSRIQDHSFSFPLLNAFMSFVVCLLGKIPVNYLIKMSDTLVRDYTPNRLGFLKLTRSVIESDLKNGKNRLNISMDKPAKKKTTEGFTRYFVD